MGIHTEAVQKLYVAYFSRPADTAGLAYWENVITNMGGDTSVVSAAFAASQEYKDSFAGQSPYQVVNTIYLNLFGRPAEPAALEFWGQNLIKGAFTVDTAVTTIAAGAVNAEGQLNSDGIAYANKVKAATAFTNALDTSAEILAYSGTAANAAAKSWLSGVTTDASLETAIAPANLNASVDVVTGIGEHAVGQTYNLTSGVDTFVGTNGADVFNANPYTSAGTAASTLQSFDSIDGGAGTDTLNIVATAGNNNEIVGTVKNVEIINIKGSDYIGNENTQANQEALELARANVTKAQTALDVAQAAEDAAEARIDVVADARILIDATVNELADMDVDGMTVNAVYNAVLTAINGVSTDAATKAAVIAWLNNANADDEIFTEYDLVGIPPNQTQVPRDATPAEVLENAINAALAGSEDAYEDAVDDEIDADEEQDEAANDLENAEEALEEAEAAVQPGVISAGSFAGSTKISVDGLNTTINGVGAQTIVFTGQSANNAIDNAIAYNATATTANVTVTNARGNVDLTGAGLTTVNLGGTVRAANSTTAGTVTLTEGTGTNVKTLNLNTTTAAQVNVTGLDALTTINGANATGALTILGAASTVSSIATGAGNDTVTLSTAASSTVKTASVNTGAGNDKVTVNINSNGVTGVKATVDTGAGNDTITIANTGSTAVAMTINAGAGNDTVIFRTLSDVATSDGVDGGEGTDSIAIDGASLVAADYVMLSEIVKNFEDITFRGTVTGTGSTAEGADASRMSNFKSITLSADQDATVKSIDGSVIRGIANDQIINIKAGTTTEFDITDSNSNPANEILDLVKLTSGGYKVGANDTVTYGGTLNVNVTAAGKLATIPQEDDINGPVAPVAGTTAGVQVAAYAETVNLSVAATSKFDAGVELVGDSKIVTVKLANAAVTDATTKEQIGLKLAGFELDAGGMSIQVADFGYNEKVTSVTLEGTGVARIGNGEGAALATVDASKLTGQAWDAEAEEVVTGWGLQYTSDNNSVAETIILSAGNDMIRLGGSTFESMDTITGFTVVADADAEGDEAVLDKDLSDMLWIDNASSADFVAVESKDLVGNSLNQVLVNLASKTVSGSNVDNIVFQYQGNTYVYVDVGNAQSPESEGYGVLSDNDVLVKLTGTIDLDLLVQAVGHTPN